MATMIDSSITDPDMEYLINMPERLHSFVLVWLCPSDVLAMLPLDRFKNIHIIKSVETVGTPFICISRLSELRNEKIILIISNTSAKNVVSIVHDETNIFYIYLFSSDGEIDFQWMRNFSKVHGPYFDIDALISEILSNADKSVGKADKIIWHNEDSCSIVVYKNTKSGSLTENLDEASKSFIYFQLLIDVLLLLPTPTNDSDKKIALNKCREYYFNNNAQLKQIEEFETTYTPNDAIRWYTRDSFYSRILNKVFRGFDLTLVFAFRSFIVDLYNQLDMLYTKQNMKLQRQITLYAGQMLSAVDLQSLKDNIGGLISMTTFFVTTRSVEVALVFCGDGLSRPQFESVLFQINIDSGIRDARPFADIMELSVFKDEEEVLFGIGSVFKIISLEFSIESNIWQAKLTCDNEVQTEVRELKDWYKMDIDTPINYITFGNVLNKLNKTKETKTYYELLLQGSSLTVEDLARVYSNLGTAYQLEKNYHQAMKNYRKAIKICKSVSRNTDKLTNSLKTEPPYDKHLLLQAKVNDSSELLSQIYSNIGSLYQSNGDDHAALDNFEKAFSIASEAHIQSLNLGIVQSNIGSIYLLQGNKDIASLYFQEALHIALDTLPSEHPFIRQCLSNIESLIDRQFEVNDVTSTTKLLEGLGTTISNKHDVTADNKDLQTSITLNDKYDVPPP